MLISYDCERQFMVTPRLKVFVFDGSCIGHFGGCVVDNGIALKVCGSFNFPMYKAQAPVVEPSDAEVEIFVDTSGEEYVSGFVFQFSAAGGEVGAGAHFCTFEQCLDERVVSAVGYPLIPVVEIVVVKRESQWYAAYDEGWQFFGRSSPLFFGVAFDEAFVDVAAA